MAFQSHPNGPFLTSRRYSPCRIAEPVVTADSAIALIVGTIDCAFSGNSSLHLPATVMSFPVVQHPVHGLRTMRTKRDGDRLVVTDNVRITIGDSFTVVDERLYISAVTEAFIFGPWFDRSGVATSANALAVPELDDSNDSLLGDPNAPWYVDMSKLKDRTFFDFPTRPHFVASVAVAYDMDGYITSRLSTVPNTDYSVPAGIDLTTVEMLTFFPGYLKDPFFLYRCVSVGWDSKGLEKALWTHRNQDYLPFQTIKENIIHTMMALTGIQDYGALASINHVALWQRSKFEDYTSAAFARSRDFAAGELPEATDLRLSDLSMNVTAYPQNEDAGMLTALVQAYGQGQ